MTYKCDGNAIFQYLMRKTGSIVVSDMRIATHMGYMSVKRLADNEIDARTLNNLRRHGFGEVIQYVDAPNVEEVGSRTYNRNPQVSQIKFEPIPLFDDPPTKEPEPVKVTPEMIQAIKNMSWKELLDLIRRADVRV